MHRLVPTPAETLSRFQRSSFCCCCYHFSGPRSRPDYFGHCKKKSSQHTENPDFYFCRHQLPSKRKYLSFPCCNQHCCIVEQRTEKKITTMTIIIIIIIINSWFSAPPTTRTMTHYTVQFNSGILELSTVSSLEQECFQGTLENWHRTHQLEFCWQPVPCSRAATEKRPSPNFRRVLGTT